MKQFVDFGFYKDSYIGDKITEPRFNALAIRATSYINYITSGRIDPENITENVKMATCAVAEVILKHDKNGDKSSESAGKMSVTYVTKGTPEKKMYSAAYPYLAHTGLLYRGVGK